MAVNQRPVSRQIYQVRRDQREHHWLGLIHSLQVAPEDKIKQQRKRGPVQSVQIRNRLIQDTALNVERTHNRPKQHDQPHQNWRYSQAQIHTVHQHAMALFQITRAVSVRNKRVQTQHQAGAENRDSDVENASQADRADRRRAVCLAPHHHRVHDAHGHPTQFGADQWHGQAQHRPRFFRNIVDEQALQHNFASRDHSAGSAPHKTRRTKSIFGSLSVLR